MPTGTENTVAAVSLSGYSPALELIDKDSVQNWFLGLDDNDGDKFEIGRGYGPGQGLTPALTIDTSDNVGIGTTSPGGKLDVNGTIYQRGGSLHADYVFETDYALESIEEHSVYMWTHKHLRAVPAVEYDENGLEMLEVGAHRRGILEELEKAHVYIEQLNERIKVLEAAATAE